MRAKAPTFLPAQHLDPPTKQQPRFKMIGRMTAGAHIRRWNEMPTLGLDASGMIFPQRDDVALRATCVGARILPRTRRPRNCRRLPYSLRDAPRWSSAGGEA